MINLIFLSGCTKESISDLKTPDWTDKTHSNSADPDYNVVFPEGSVLRFDITIEPADWSKMQIDDHSYNTIYKDFTASFIQGHFSVSSFDEIIDRQAELIRESVQAEVTGYTFLLSPSVFDNAVEELKQHVRARQNTVISFTSK